VRAYGSSQVRAYDSSQVRAYGSSQVRAYDSSQVTAYDSSQVRAYGSSQVRAYDSSQVRASKFVAVTRHGKKVKTTGGVRIKLPVIKTAKQWCDFYGVPIKAGVAVLFKVVRDDYKSGRGFLYQPGTTPEAPDWDGGKLECGGGLHFSPTPVHAQAFDEQGKKFIACPVLVKEIKVHPNPVYPAKVKAPRVYRPCYEVDINRKTIGRVVSQ
jgi:hypothetical protein